MSVLSVDIIDIHTLHFAYTELLKSVMVEYQSFVLITHYIHPPRPCLTAEGEMVKVSSFYSPVIVDIRVWYI